MTKKTKMIALSASHKEYAFINPLEKSIKYKGENVTIKLYEDPNGFSYVLWKNKKFPLEIIEKKQNKYTVMLNGVWHTFTVETPFSVKRKKFLKTQEGESTSFNIEAPMPGKIIEIIAEEGGEVNAGEPLLILEAMKMQNEIASPVNGTIKKIAIRQNDSVMKDDLLIEIEKNKFFQFFPGSVKSQIEHLLH
ncbi:MAG: acetyl-CoA carboxylase biotin carboxyl carrier protein subunit [Bacteroidales bacterium]|jgi:biotin carboxyl carrier protein|nr:acetyl-CoA carboxylase biotin carboxyl carrier protein subunit [Bacteroidales bacterium]